MTNIQTIEEQFQRLATTLIQEAPQYAALIDAYQPDLIIGLAHSGWLPVLAAQTWWEVRYSTPFPPALRLNFGSEKIAPFDDLWGDDDINLQPMDYTSPVLIACLWHWLLNQTTWHEELRHMVTAVFPHPSPQRILVVDETIFEGTTYALITGLLAAVYPQAQVKFASGRIALWGSTATKAWLARFAPALLPIFNEDNFKKGDNWEKGRKWRRALRWVAAGTEDLADPLRLACAPVDLNSQSINLLSAYLPAEQWLTLSEWAHSTLLAGVKKQAALGPDETTLPKLEIRDGRPWDFLALRTLWQQGSLSRHALKALIPPEVTAAEWIDSLVSCQEIVPRGWRKNVHYQPGPEYRPGISQANSPADNAYVVIPDRVWAGPQSFKTTYPHAGIRWLHTQQIDVVLDLIGQTAVIDKELAEFNETTPFSLTVHSLPWTVSRPPDPLILKEALDWLSYMLASGKRIYIQSETGNGRAAVAAAALLVKNGATPRQAWRQLQASWRQTAWGPYLRLPARDSQRRFILQLHTLRPHW